KFISETDIERQVRSKFEIVLHEETELALTPHPLLSLIGEELWIQTARSIERLSLRVDRSGQVQQHTLCVSFVRSQPRNAEAVDADDIGKTWSEINSRHDVK